MEYSRGIREEVALQSVAKLKQLDRAGEPYLQSSLFKPGDFTICVTKGDGTHPLTIRARTTLTGYDVDDRPFGSLREIINYYSRQPIFIDNCIDNSHYFLLHVIQREDWRDS
ncbi:hypothetical protein HOLleu_27083 [Holothuria leucospilota]|uniref:SH2 domain-containing protein n=1 Tax=Holothuria leucospilota TaxID=206669 RepID=A0A9Q1BQB2_HOLLE|nr:hypothetical protein HOLleu_27083 [Holothuria leucospilota]